MAGDGTIMSVVGIGGGEIQALKSEVQKVKGPLLN